MSEEKIVGEEEKVTPEEPTKIIPEEKPASEPVDNETDWEAEANRYKAEAEKAKATAENYKREIEIKGLRVKKDASQNELGDDGLNDEQVALVKNDYDSKREDAIHELQEEFKKLPDDSWNKIKDLVAPALDNLFNKAVGEKRYVARGEITKALSGLIEYGNGDKGVEEKIKKAKLEGMKEKLNYENAEIIGVKKRERKPSEIEVNDEDKKVEEDTGGMVSAERAAEIRAAKAARDKEFAPSSPY